MKEKFEKGIDELKRGREIIDQDIKKIPLLAPLMVAFGLVATLYGFEKVIDQTFLVNEPWLLLGSGVFVLLLTGAFYDKL